VTLLFFAGFLFRFDDMPSYWQWYSYINFLRYAWSALMINQFEGEKEEFPVKGGPIQIAGQPILSYYGQDDFKSEWEAIGYECLFFIAFFFLSWAALQFSRLNKR
jgi:ATP-binding cassette, subfamily G (WHITE), member 2